MDANTNEVLVEKSHAIESMDTDAVRERTFGEQIIGITFDKGNNKTDQNLKEHYARMINRVKKLENPNNGRLISMAVTDLEVGCMKAIKALFNR